MRKLHLRARQDRRARVELPVPDLRCQESNGAQEERCSLNDWLADPHVITLLVPDMDAPDAYVKQVLDQIVQGGKALSGHTYSILPPSDPRFVVAVDTTFVRLVRELPVDVFTPTLLDRARGVVEIVRVADGSKLKKHVRVAFLRAPNGDGGDPAERTPCAS